ncbi:hypothetical protein NKDENANG_01759 [Candidatus Entotheonellaceae bacterium PAL068K]
MLHTAMLLLAAMGGSLHCLGMCGGIITAVNALSKSASRRHGLVSHVAYHSGRLTSYLFLGAMAGACGQIVASPAPFLHTLIDLSAGLFVLGTGLRLLGLLPARSPVQLMWNTTSLTRSLAALLRVKRLSSSLVLGLFNGFIPCPLIAAFLAQAAASGSPFEGALIMAILVVGTAPGMMLMGFIVLSHETRGKAVRAAGGLLALLGAMTLLHAVSGFPSPFREH